MSENWKIQVSPKLPDGTLINIRAESADELTALLQYASSNAQLIADTVGLLAAARNATPLTTGQPPSASTQSFPSQPQPPAQQGGFAPQQPAQGGGGPTCEHGAYIWKDFVSQKGNQVKGWFCPANFRTQCKPDFRK